MTTDEFTAELFRGYDRHFDEVRRLKNLITMEKDGVLHDEYRKSLVVVLYAHFEGFCVFGLQHYLAAVNRAGVDCQRAVPAILAGSWEPIFTAMETGDQKCRVFARELPADEKLHRHWRRRHFVEEVDKLLSRPVFIPEDTIDAESNLKPQVLRRNLFLLGLDHTFVDPHTVIIHNLLARRNAIAHGNALRGVPSQEYEGFENSVFQICYQLIEFLTDAFGNERYLKPRPYDG